MGPLRDHAALRGAVATFAAIVGGLAVLGAVSGLVWSHVAPRTAFVMTQAGPLAADPETQSLIEADGWFTLLTGGLGLLAGIAVYCLAQRHLVAGVLGLAGGGMLASLLALRVGSSASGVVQAAGPGGIHTSATLGLTATAAIVACPLVATGSVWLFEFASSYWIRPAKAPPEAPRPVEKPVAKPLGRPEKEPKAAAGPTHGSLLSRRRGRHAKRRLPPMGGR
ncbi:hypothetical protein J5X84_04950 [Streptosporangiaceae bacterium NEAU-GS5]|nr:hypothetical protein [Streptosporangiaceae bacterium NEAU-GS5]